MDYNWSITGLAKQLLPYWSLPVQRWSLNVVHLAYVVS